MKLKQLEALRSQHEKNLKRKAVEKPSFNKAIAVAIVQGQPIKVRPASAILAAAQKQIAECSCSYGSSERKLNFSDIFDFKSEELAAYEKAEAERLKKLAAYNKKAEPILRRAEMDDTVDATEASEALAQAAHDAGLLE